VTEIELQEVANFRQRLVAAMAGVQWNDPRLPRAYEVLSKIDGDLAEFLKNWTPPEDPAGSLKEQEI
jgi:hypothetical protein